MSLVIYLDARWQEELKGRGITIITPVKLQKGQELLDSADKLLSSAVSRARQAVESFNNWIHQKTNIQSASKVRSDNGLISFVFARIAALVWFNWWLALAVLPLLWFCYLLLWSCPYYYALQSMCWWSAWQCHILWRYGLQAYHFGQASLLFPKFICVGLLIFWHCFRSSWLRLIYYIR